MLSCCFKSNMRAALDHRFPITDLHVCAAMLDPSQRHLQVVQDYLDAREITGVQFLSDMLDKYVTATAPISDETIGNHVTDDGTRGETSWKKAKMDLLAKHVSAAASSNNRELQQYRCISLLSDDLLQWWKGQTETFPRLSVLARGILAIPATSAPCERVFSIAGLTLQAKRSSLAPAKVNKIVFVHNNGHLVSE